MDTKVHNCTIIALEQQKYFNSSMGMVVVAVALSLLFIPNSRVSEGCKIMKPKIAESQNSQHNTHAQLMDGWPRWDGWDGWDGWDSVQ